MDFNSGETGGRPRMLGDMAALQIQNTEKITTIRYGVKAQQRP